MDSKSAKKGSLADALSADADIARAEHSLGTFLSRVTLGHMQLRHGICIPACLLSEVGQAACSYACYKFEI